MGEETKNAKLSSRERRQKALQRQQQSQTVPSTRIRAAELYFKNRVDEPDWSQALSSNNVDWSPAADGIVDQVSWGGETLRRSKVRVSGKLAELTGRENNCQMHAVTVKSMPGKWTHDNKTFKKYSDRMSKGLVYLPGLLAPRAQRNLVKCSLQDGARQPNTTSLDPHYSLPPDGIWKAFRQDASSSIPKRSSTSGQSGQRREPCNLRAINAQNFGIERSQQRESDLESSRQSPIKDCEQRERVCDVLGRLRWASVGMAYHVRFLSFL